MKNRIARRSICVSTRGERRRGIEFELVDVLTMLAPVATVAAIAHLAREPAKGGEPSALESLESAKQNPELT